jgi:hypothetical protein
MISWIDKGCKISIDVHQGWYNDRQGDEGKGVEEISSGGDI